MKNNNKICYMAIVIISMVLSGCTATQNISAPMVQNSANSDLTGRTLAIEPRAGDTLSSIGTRFDVGIVEMRHANPDVGSNRIRYGTTIVIPTQYILPPKKYRRGIVINIAELRLYYFTQDGHLVMTSPITLGRIGWRTPIGHTRVVRKQKSPPWNVPKSIREYTYKKTGKKLPAVVPPGKDNPLGDYAIYLGIPGYLIHGTNNPSSIGRLVSSGCIRLYNRDISELYRQVKKGTLVHIIYYPSKVGWQGNYLYLESHYPIIHEKKTYAKYALSARQVIQQATKKRTATIDWDKVRQIEKQHTGIPAIVGVASQP